MEGLRLAGLREEELEKLPGSDPHKAALAALIWSKTTVNMEWISTKLKMRSAPNARQQIWRFKKQISSKTKPKPLPAKFRKWLKQSQL